MCIVHAIEHCINAIFFVAEGNCAEKEDKATASIPAVWAEYL